MPKSRKAATRKNRKANKVLTIPELRSSMEHMNSYAQKLLHSKASLKQKAAAFASEWKRLFGKKLSPKVSEEYLKNMMRLHKGKFTRKRGGGALAGAPLDFQTRPGTNDPVFTDYISKGFVNPEPGLSASCGTQQGVLPQVGMGSNCIKGGGVLDSLGVTAALFRPFVAQNPVSTQQGMMNSWKGMPPSPGSASYNQTWDYRSTNFAVPITQNAIYDRDLGQQGKV
jgi:hypothetical protein